MQPATGRKLTTTEVMLSGSSDGYALGWITTTRPWAGGRTLTHDGTKTFNHSVAWLGLGSGFAVLAVTNSADLLGGTTAAALDEVASGLIAYYEASH